MKQKTVKSAKKRFSTTGTGKLMHRKMSAQHLVSGKSKRTLKNSQKKQILSTANQSRIKRLIPNR